MNLIFVSTILQIEVVVDVQKEMKPLTEDTRIIPKCRSDCSKRGISCYICSMHEEISTNNYFDSNDLFKEKEITNFENNHGEDEHDILDHFPSAPPLIDDGQPPAYNENIKNLFVSPSNLEVLPPQIPEKATCSTSLKPDGLRLPSIKQETEKIEDQILTPEVNASNSLSPLNAFRKLRKSSIVHPEEQNPNNTENNPVIEQGSTNGESIPEDNAGKCTWKETKLFFIYFFIVLSITVVIVLMILYIIAFTYIKKGYSFVEYYKRVQNVRYYNSS